MLHVLANNTSELDMNIQAARRFFSAVTTGWSRMCDKRSHLLRGFSAMLLGMLVAPSFAQTMVSGAISVNTRWTVAGAPYVVSGNVVVQDNAVLTIDPGVTIYMRGDTGLTVQSGAIKAAGTAALPVSVLSDKRRTGGTPAPGDWNQWIFNPGTVNTRLDNVIFEHGNGLSIKGSSPVLNYVSLRNHLGAAITLDLAASPTGVGLEATGNSLNGISVPAGDIGGSVRWGLRGIPYVVSSGVVSVGASPTVASVTPNTVQQGEATTLAVTGTRLSGLSGIRFEQPGLTAQVQPGGTDTQASVSVTTAANAALGPVSMRLVTEAGEARVANGITVTPMQPAIASLAPSSLFTGQGTADVTINGRNFVNQATALINGAPVATRFVSATQLVAPVAVPQTVGNLSVRLRTPDPANAGQFLLSNELLLPVASSPLVLAPASLSVVKGAERTLTLTLPFTAPAGGIAISLVSSVPTVAAVPASVLVPEGQTSVGFQMTASDLGNTVITASKPGFTSAQTSVTVVAPPTLSITPATSTLGVGRSVDLTIKSSVPAGASGLAVTLSSSNPSVATVPASITIPSGATTATATVSTVAIGSATIAAAAAEYTSGSAAISVRPLSLMLPTGALVAPGLSRSVPLTLSDPAPAGGLAVTLSSSNAAVAQVPASVTVPEGQTTVNFVLTGAATGTATVGATATGYQSASMTATVEAVTIGIGSPAVSSISVPAELSQSYAVTLSRPAPAGGVTITLTTTDASKATVSPATITIAEGQTSGGVTQAAVAGVAKGATTLVASAPGLNPASIPVTVTGKAQLFFSRSAAYVGKGLVTYQYEVYVYARTDGADLVQKQPQTITLSSADPSKATVPDSVIIPAGQTYAHFTITGVDLTGTTPVAVNALAPGYSDPATKLSAHVVTPVLNFQLLDTSRSPASGRDDFRFTFTTPGSTYSGQAAAADMPISLSVIDASVAGIVDGFYSAASGGVPVTQVLMRKGNNTSDTAYVGVPTAAGTYRVQANVPGVVTANSGLVTVSAPELRFSRGSINVAKGTKSYIAEVYVYRSINGGMLYGVEPLTVALAVSDGSKVSIPASVTIPAGQSSASFNISGIELTGGTPVTIDASASGYTTPATKLAVNIVPPVLVINELDVNRSPASARDNFRFYLGTPAGSSYGPTAISDFAVNLSIFEANPAGIVDGFYSALTGGSSIASVLVRKDSNWGDYAYIGTPTTSGSYKVQLDAPAVSATAISPLVNVVPPELKFTSPNNTNRVTVGKAMKSYQYEIGISRTAGGTAFAGSEAVVIALTSSDPSKVSVPATITIPAGQSNVYFYVTGVDLTGAATVTIDATASGYSSPVTKLSASVVAPVFNINSLALNRSPASTRNGFNFYVTVPGAYYSSNQTAAADLPVSVSIIEASPSSVIDGIFSAATGGVPVTQMLLRANSTYSETVYVGTPTTAGTYKVALDASGVASVVSPVVTVSAPELRFAPAGNRSNVVVGKGLKTYGYEVYVYRAASGTAFNGTDALTVNLACASASICSVPASVTIPAGQSSAFFTVEGVGLGSTVVAASAAGYSAPQDLAVNVVTAQLSVSAPANINVGGNAGGTVTFSTSGAYYSGNQTAAQATTVNLTSSAPGIATVPATVSVQPGYTYTNFSVTGVAPGTTNVTASSSGFTSATSGTVTINP